MLKKIIKKDKNLTNEKKENVHKQNEDGQNEKKENYLYQYTRETDEVASAFRYSRKMMASQLAEAWS